MNLLKKLGKAARITPFKISLAITLVFLAASVLNDVNPSLVPIIQAIDQKSLDLKFHIRGAQAPKSKIIVVAADEKSFAAFGQWPFDRGTVFAPFLKEVCRRGAKVVGMDMVWTDREKLIAPNLKDAIEKNFASKRDLRSLLREASGDDQIRDAMLSCKNKVVLGYAPTKNPTLGLSGSEFKKRVETLTTQGGNVLLARKRGRIRFARFRADKSANASFFFDARGGQFNVPEIVPPGAAQGFMNAEDDGDGNYRRGLMLFRIDDFFVPSLPLRMAQKALSPNDEPPSLRVAPNLPDEGLTETLELSLKDAKGPRAIPIDLYGQTLINYRGPNLAFPNVSLADVLSSSEAVPVVQTAASGEIKTASIPKTELFKDALVLFGVTAMSLYDIRPRPLDELAAGVENHANILDNLLNDDFLVRPSPSAMAMLLLAILSGSLLYGMAINRLGAGLGALFAALTMAGLVFFDQFFLFNERNIVYSGHVQAMQFLFQYIAITVFKYMKEESEKKFIRSAFDKYVSPAVIDSMLRDPARLKLGGEKKELSVLFSDIRGFTALSERMDAKQLTVFLNEYLGSMTEILQKNLGTLDKYIGDAVMGFWGAPVDNPAHASCAVRSAAEMLRKLDELNIGFEAKYGFGIDIGIGINSGPMSVGNFGSSKVFEYTVIGDGVNLASRIESVTKYYGAKIIVSESTHRLLKPGEFLTREVDTVRVQGKKRPVKIFEVLPEGPRYEPLKESLGKFREGLSNYYSRRWEEAIDALEALLQVKTDDQPTIQLLERCKHYKKNPPPQDWDGSWEMKSK